MVNNVSSAVFLDGAGVSTESGIPDFRSKDGLCHKTEKRFARYQHVQEIHGTTWRNHCTVYGAAYGVDFIFESTGRPRYPKCGGMVRPDVTLYGEFLPKEAHDRARKMIRNADLLIIGGTSLQVGSAAGLRGSSAAGIWSSLTRVRH